MIYRQGLSCGMGIRKQYQYDLAPLYHYRNLFQLFDIFSNVTHYWSTKNTNKDVCQCTGA